MNQPEPRVRAIFESDRGFHRIKGTSEVEMYQLTLMHSENKLFRTIEFKGEILVHPIID